MFWLAVEPTLVPDKIDPAGNLDRNDYLALRHREYDAIDNKPVPPPIPAMPVLDMADTELAIPGGDKTR